MRYLTIIFIILFGCKNENEKVLLVEKNAIEIDQEVLDLAREVCLKDDTFLPFENNLNKIDYSIDSLKIEKKEFVGKYMYCGKSSINTNLFNFLDKKELQKIKKINTAHNVINNKDTIYLNGYEDVVGCFKEEKKVLIGVDVFKLYKKDTTTNILIIEYLNPI